MTAVNVRKSTSARGSGVFLAHKKEGKKQRKISLNNNVVETGQRDRERGKN